MKHMGFKILLLVLSLCVHLQSGFAGERLPVFVSIAPQQYFVQQIGKELVDVSILVAPGASPHTYEPKPQQMAALSKTRLYFAIGVEFEKAWLRRIAASNPQMKIVHTDQDVPKIPMAAHHHHDHEKMDSAPHKHHETNSHKHESESHDSTGHTDNHHHHDHGSLDPHIWLSPPLVKLQARAILLALQEADPVHGDIYEANYKQFIDEIDNLDAELRAMFAGKQGLQFMVFHPAWGYFAQAYNLRQVPVEVEGKDPKPQELQALIEHARSIGTIIIFVQPQFSSRNAETVAREINGRVVFADPLAKDWLANLQAVASEFKAALK